MIDLMRALAALPLVAILRGIRPEEADAIGAALVESGFVLIEVPLNSPEPFASIERLARRFEAQALIGAGTVVNPADVDRVESAGGRLIVMPHGDPVVVRRAKRFGLAAMPGFATPSEAFIALAAGADALKLFPAEANPPAVLKAMKAVLPKQIPVLPVGGITPDRMAGYRQAGAAGFGLGSALYKPGDTPADVAKTATAFVDAWRALQA
jgi:2-dehydro-3-deoxyphosphogalactonate aldolase